MALLHRVIAAVAPPLALALIAHSARAIVIDDFTEGTVVINGPAELDQTGLGPERVIGGARRFSVGRFGSGSRLEIADGLKFHSTGNGYFTISYGAVEPISGVLLTANGHDRLRIVLGDVDAPIHYLNIYVNVPPVNSSDAVGTHLRDGWDGLVLDVPFAKFPHLIDSVSTIIVDSYRNPPGTGFGIRSLATAPPRLTGDFNADGVVDAADLETWRAYFGVDTRNGSLVQFIAAADANADGRVDGGDLLAWQQAMATPATQSVPEPTTGALLAAATIAVCRLSRRRRGRP